jgi:nitroreductase
MAFLELARSRYSTRSYQSRPVSADDLATILEAGRVAPTACNNQPQRLLVVRGEDGLAKLAKGSRVFGAPLAIIVCADHAASWKRSYDGKDSADIDASIVTTHLMLQAAELGLSTLWICSFKAQVIRDEFNIPANIEPINILLIGYEAGQPKSPDRHASERLPLDRTVVQDAF